MKETGDTPTRPAIPAKSGQLATGVTKLCDGTQACLDAHRLDLTWNEIVASLRVGGTGWYTLMDGSTIRTPGTGLWNVNDTNLENYGVPPDVYVDNTPDDFLKGRDAQIEKAVEVLKEEVAKKK